MSINLLFTAFSALLLTSCAQRNIYSPTAHNVPAFTKKSESKIAAGYSTGSNSTNEDKANGFDVQTAYAVSNHVVLQAGYTYRQEESVDSSQINFFDYSNIKYNRKMFEIGIGYFTSIHKKGKIFFSIYGGIGVGKFSFIDNGIDNNQLSYSRFHNANVTKYYLNPAVSFINKRLVVSASLRGTLIYYSRIQTNYTIPEQESLKIGSINRKPSFFTEPAGVVSYGFRKLPGLRIECQLGFSFGLPAENQDGYYTGVSFCAGLVFDIPKFIKGIENNPKD